VNFERRAGRVSDGRPVDHRLPVGEKHRSRVHYLLVVDIRTTQSLKNVHAGPEP
jgi:hypothetical protein